MCATILGAFFFLVFPQYFALAGDGLPPGCAVPRGYDCATPGFERPMSLEAAKALSRKETVVYLYGKGLQDARIVAKILREGRNGVPIPAIAVPGASVPADAFYILIKGRVVRHKKSGEPVKFFQRYMNRGTVFVLTRKMMARRSG